MSAVLFSYPKQAEFGRIIPKNKIYEHTKPNAALKAKFVSEIDQIVWQYKLSPETVNLPAHVAAPEIQVFSVSLKTSDLSEGVLRCIDLAIPFPIFYQLSFENRLKTVAAFKYPNDADPGKWLVTSYFDTDWMPSGAPPSTLPVALDLGGLYERMLRELMPISARPGEPLLEQVSRYSAIQAKQREVSNSESFLNKERQFNRKVEINARVRELKTELEELNS